MTTPLTQLSWTPEQLAKIIETVVDCPISQEEKESLLRSFGLTIPQQETP